MKITFLGTSSMVPTKDRNVQAIFLRYKAEGILIDCGEGTQRQMNIAGINRNKVNKVLISHWHGDHVSGLIGLIQTLGNNMEEKPVLQVYGPKGTKERMHHMLKTVVFDNNRVELKIHELNPKNIKKFFENDNYYIECAYLNHSVPCLGYNFIEKDRLRIDVKKAKKIGLKQGPLMGKLQKGKTVEFKGKKIKPEDVTYNVKGKKITFILDTLPCTNAVKLAKDADLMICESVYHSSLKEKSHVYKHMTAQDAALIANKANAKKLILTHFSQRYKEINEVLKDAKDVFNNTEAAFDFKNVKV
ncbi:ribonuclease Z [Candidatus Woesearchaeota archaeon]|nr:ribonuclease Z [Candidatus Woesearchaeota archaeon]